MMAGETYFCHIKIYSSFTATVFVLVDERVRLVPVILLFIFFFLFIDL